MFKIGEFSKIAQVSVRMLRYYDEQKLLVPQHVDPVTGYRLYSVDQIEVLNRIVFLRNMGFGVEEMKKLLCFWNTDTIRKSLLEQMNKSAEIIRGEELKRKQMQTMIDELDHPENRAGIDIVLKQLPMQQVISMRKTVPDYYCEGEMWEEFAKNIENRSEIQKLRSFSIYHDLDYREEDVDIEICIATEGKRIKFKGDAVISRQISQVDVAACFMVFGPYSNISKAYREFAYWLEQHKEYRMQGENRQICHVTMCHTDNPEDYVTELQIPLQAVTDKRA